MEEKLEGEKRYYDKGKILITNVRIELKGAVYSTNYIIKVWKSASHMRKLWEIPSAIMTVMFLLFFGRSCIQQTPNLPMLIMSLMFGLYAYTWYRRPLQTFVVYAKMTTGEEITFPSKKEKDQTEIFEALSKALAFWRIHQTRKEEPKTRVERFHS